MRRRPVRRGAPPHRSRSARTRRPTRIRRPVRARERALVRRQPGRRRGRYGGRTRTSLRLGTPLVTVAVMVAVVVAAVASYLLARHGIRAAGDPASGTPPTTAAQIVYTARTADDAAVILPGVVQDNLRQAAVHQQSVELTRVSSTGNVSTSDIDMTPRTGNSSTDPILKVGGRVTKAINDKISAIETAINSPAGSGGRALYVGLAKADFTSAPVTIVSTGLDLVNPDNFRALQWSVPPAEVVATVKKAGAMPALHGPVTFVLVPTAGPQPQLDQAQKDYLQAVWTALLTAAGATSVTFIDATGTTANSAAPKAPTVPVPGFPSTPIPQVHRGDSVTCTVPDSYFIFGTAELVDPAQTVQNLTPCIDAALAAHASFALDGWASYEGPLNADGQPEFDYPVNQKLSKERVQTIANLMVRDLEVPKSAITRQTAHGNFDQPDPSDPSSAANRVVVITYTTK